MRAKYLGLLLITLYTLLAAWMVLFGPENVILRSVLCLPLILVLPGYTFSTLLFPEESLPFPERAAISLGLSLGLTIIGGFALYAAGYGLETEPWIVYFGGLILSASAATLVRLRSELPALQPSWVQKVSLGQVALFSLALVIASGSLWLARTSEADVEHPGFTQLWLLPSGRGGPELRLGVRSEEPYETRYELVLELNGGPVVHWPEIELKPGESWETTVTIPAAAGGTDKIEAKLFRLDTPNSVYRQVVLHQAGR